MQKGHSLQFCCQACQTLLSFSIFEIEKEEAVVCSYCNLVYAFDDEDLKRQLKKFEKLCCQIQLSEEILSMTSIGIHLGDREIKVPYKLLLTRLNSTLDLMMGEHPLTITFRIEPTNMFPLEDYTRVL